MGASRRLNSTRFADHARPFCFVVQVRDQGRKKPDASDVDPWIRLDESAETGLAKIVETPSSQSDTLTILREFPSEFGRDVKAKKFQLVLRTVASHDGKVDTGSMRWMLPGVRGVVNLDEVDVPGENLFSNVRLLCYKPGTRPRT